jgi:hypothetical protein
VLGQGEGIGAGRGERGGGSREKKMFRGRDFYFLLNIERLHSPSIYSPGKLIPKQSKLILQKIKGRVLIDLDCFLYKQNYLFPNKS